MTIEYRTVGDVALVTLNRPEFYNTINKELAASLREAIGQAGRDARAIVLTGAGEAFSAGADLKALLREHGEQDLGSVTRDRFNPIIEAIDQAPVPTIAAVNGPAAGAGMGLALACDLRVMASSAYFMSAFINVALAPDSGSTWFLPRIVGVAKATEIAFSGRRVHAEEAERIGLAHRVVSQEDTLKNALSWAAELADGPTEAYVISRRLLRSDGTLSEALAAEDRAQAHLGAQPAFLEGATAFTEKRTPDFRSADSTRTGDE